MKIPTSFLPHSVEVELYEGRGGDGVIYSAPKHFKCRVDWGVERKVEADGEEVTSKAVLMFHPDAEVIPVKSKVTYGEREGVVAEWNEETGLNSLVYREVVLV